MGKTIKEIVSEITSYVATYVFEIQNTANSFTSKITWANLLKPEKDARESQDNVIEASAGFKADGTYGINEANSTDTWFLNAAGFTAGCAGRGGLSGALTPTVKNGLRILDAKINAFSSLVSTPILVAEVNVTGAEILACHSLPVKLIQVQEASEVYEYSIDVLSIVARNEGSAFTSANEVKIVIGSSTTAIYTIPNAFVISNADTAYKAVQQSSLSVFPGSLKMTMAANPTAGSGPWKFFIAYRVIRWGVITSPE